MFVQVDMRRANNCEIMLTKVKVPLPEVIVSSLENRLSTCADHILKFPAKIGFNPVG